MRGINGQRKAAMLIEFLERTLLHLAAAERHKSQAAAGTVCISASQSTSVHHTSRVLFHLNFHLSKVLAYFHVQHYLQFSGVRKKISTAEENITKRGLYGLTTNIATVRRLVTLIE